MKDQYDVVVIGGGVFGSAVTYELAKRSVSVLLVDKQLPGRATSASAGGLWPVGESIGLGCGVIYHANEGGEQANQLPPQLPQCFQQFLQESHRCFPQLAEDLLELSGVDIEFEVGPGLFYGAYDDQEQQMIRSIAAGLSEESQLSILTPGYIKELEPLLSEQFIGGGLLPGEYQVNPMALAEAYKRAALRLGAEFKSGLVQRLLTSQGRVNQAVLQDGSISANTFVNAAGSWSRSLAQSAGLELPVTPIRGQVVLTETLPKIMNLSISTTQCYLLQKKHGEILIGSTTEDAGFDVSVTPEAIGQLCRGAIRAIPMLEAVSVKRTWAGLRPGTSDELPILGPVPDLEGYVNATGGFRTGIVASPLAGIMIAQSIVGEPLRFGIEPYLAERFL